MNNRDNICGNCGTRLETGDKYCRNCGTKRGEGKFLPKKNLFATLYGPMLVTRFKCSMCGKEWTENTIGHSTTKYCPKCGNSSLISESGRFGRI